jgi:hypothetical protein
LDIADLISGSLQQFVSIFESFLSEAFRQWLLAYPASLSSRQLSGKQILGLLVEALVDKELKNIFYDRPIDWFEYLEKERSFCDP